MVVSNTDPNLTNVDVNNDGEPSIAINPRFPLEIAITAGFSFWGANSVLWHTTNGGLTWTRRLTIPVPPGQPGAIGCPCDQTIDFGRFNQLAGTFLIGPPENLVTGTTTHRADPASWAWRAVGGITQLTNRNVPSAVGNADQPWLLVNRDPFIASQDDIYVGYDDFGNGDRIDGPDMRVAVSYGTTPPDFTMDNQTGNSVGAMNPGHRLAVDKHRGFVYSLFQRNVAPGAGNSKNIDYMLNRSINGGITWGLNGNPNGIVIANADSTQPTPKFGTVNALLGGVLHAAVDEQTGDVYYVYGHRDPATGNDRVAVRRIQLSSDNAVVVGPEYFVSGQVEAALPSVAVAADGAVGVLYDTFDGFSSAGFPIFPLTSP